MGGLTQPRIANGATFGRGIYSRPAAGMGAQGTPRLEVCDAAQKIPSLASLKFLLDPHSSPE